MNGFWAFVLLIGSTAWGSLHGSSHLGSECPDWSTLSFSKLEAGIRSHAMTSIEEVLTCLPEAHKRNWTLFFASKSNHGSSFSHPRAILFGEDARFILTFNGDPKHSYFHRLETMEFDFDANELKLREVIFPKDPENHSSEVLFPKSNESNCAACHQRNFRPIFEAYNQWPGAYGEDNDKLRPQEQKEYADFLLRRANDDRYKILQQIEDKPASPYAFGYEETFYQTRTNLRFMDYLLRYNARRVVGMFKKKADLYEKYKYYLAFRIESCAYKYLSSKSFDEMEAEIVRDLASRGIQHTAQSFTSYPYGIPEHLLKVFDVEMKDWSISLDPKTFDYETGQGDFRKLVAGTMMAELTQDRWEHLSESYLNLSDPQKPGFALHKKILQSLDFIGGYSNRYTYDARCDLLGQKLIKY